jgi:F-type H+-transporting ATPase subunit a
VLGENLPLSYFVHDPKICNAPFLGVPGLGTVGDIHVDTIAMTVAAMTLILGTAAVITPKLTFESAGGTGQNVLEMYYDFIEDMAKGQIGHVYKAFLPLIAAIFIFVLISNFLGVGPWKVFEEFFWWPYLKNKHPFELTSATTDFNVTFGLATIALLTYLGSGVWAHGPKYVLRYINPIKFMDMLIEWLDFGIRPATLAMRLMLVITADEILRAIALLMVPVLLPVGVMGFELFIGLIQAFVFALLTSIYIGLTVSHH